MNMLLKNISYENYTGAKELFFVLSNIIDDEKLCTALQVHIIALSKKIDLDSFYEKEVDLNTINEDKNMAILSQILILIKKNI